MKIGPIFAGAVAREVDPVTVAAIEAAESPLEMAMEEARKQREVAREREKEVCQVPGGDRSGESRAGVWTQATLVPK